MFATWPAAGLLSWTAARDGFSQRELLDDAEWRWLAEQTTGDFDHLVLANTLPVLLPRTFHYLEAFSEGVCAGAWGPTAARVSEWLRQAFDLEHWAAFQNSFHRLLALTREIGAGRRGSAPASILFLGGDVHQGYLHEAAFRPAAGVRSVVYQAVCSPFRNPLPRLDLLESTTSPSRSATLIQQSPTNTRTGGSWR